MTTRQMYGHFRGGDPRRFTPDREVCTPEEIAAWEKACVAWNRGDKVEPKMAPFSFESDGFGVFYDGSDYGVGLYEYDCDGTDCVECDLKEG